MIDIHPGVRMRRVRADGRRLAETAPGTESRTPPGYSRQQYGTEGNPVA